VCQSIRGIEMRDRRSKKDEAKLAAVKVRPVVDMHAVNQLLPECRFAAK